MGEREGCRGKSDSWRERGGGRGETTGETSRTFVLLLGFVQLPKVGGGGDNEDARAKNVTQDVQCVAVGAAVPLQQVRVHHSVHQAVGPVPQEVPEPVTKLWDIFADPLLWIIHPPVHVRELVVRL